MPLLTVVSLVKTVLRLSKTAVSRIYTCGVCQYAVRRARVGCGSEAADRRVERRDEGCQKVVKIKIARLPPRVALPVHFYQGLDGGSKLHKPLPVRAASGDIKLDKGVGKMWHGINRLLYKLVATPSSPLSVYRCVVAHRPFCLLVGIPRISVSRQLSPPSG